MIASGEDIVADYIEIESPKEIATLNRKLSEKLEHALGYERTRTIGFPRGTIRRKVRFASNKGDNVFWWSAGPYKNRAVAHNLFGRGAPDNNASLFIDVQFNVPVAKFSRKSGGAFLRDIATNKIVLAHRGIATRHHGRIPKKAIFDKLGSKLLISTDAREFLLIGEMESPALVDNIANFASKLRQALASMDPSQEVASKKPATRMLPTKKVHSLPTRTKIATTVLKTRPRNFQLDYKVGTKKAIHTARNLEAKLVSDYRCWLEEQDKSRNLQRFACGHLECDGFENERGNLIEAKSSTRRECIRMAVGQLLDYSFQAKSKLGIQRMAILLPRRPDLWSVKWLKPLRISLVWKAKGHFEDNAGGDFT